MTPITHCRALAAQIIVAVCTQGQSLNQALPYYQKHCADADKGLLQELCFGVLRWRLRLANICNQLAPKGFSDNDQDLLALCLVGLYQLIYTRVPEHAAVGETVEACRVLNKPWATSLVNGILRNFLRQQTALETQADSQMAIRYAYPKWLYQRILQDWPSQAENVLAQGNQHPPFTLRVNAQKTTRDAYLALLNSVSLEARAHPYVPSAIILNQAVPVDKLPNFAQGWVSVQDAAGQAVAPLLAFNPQNQPLRVLDACCAPGGKTCHILEIAPQSELVALDIDESRLMRVQENLQRLGLSAQLITADAAQVDTWWDGQKFDRILLDVPCSATGVIRRHPDIKQLRKKTDIDELSIIQAKLLDTLWPLLNENGLLLYTTCSILKQENQQQVEDFMARTLDACLMEISIGERTGTFCQILPGEDDMDGFFYAKLQKVIS